MIAMLSDSMNRIGSLTAPSTTTLENSVKGAVATVEKGLEELAEADKFLKQSGDEAIALLQNYAQANPPLKGNYNPVLAMPSKSTLTEPHPIERMIDAFARNANAGQETRHEHKRLIAQLLEQVGDQVRHLLAELDAKGPAIKKISTEYLEQARAIRSSLYRSNLVVSVDRQILGFWLPFVFCLAVVGFTLPQGVRDMRSSASTFLACDTCSFFYRDVKPTP